MRLAVVAAALMLAGCVSHSDAYIRSQPPEATFQSTRSPDELILCLNTEMTAAWDNEVRFAAQVIAPGVEYDIVPASGKVGASFYYSVNVKASDDLTDLRLYRGHVLPQRRTDAMKAAVAKCAIG